jgi:pyrroline-5-carboxylate reductase
MSGYTNFAVIGAGNFGNFIIQQLLKDKAAGTVKEVVVLTRQVKYLTNNSAVHDVLTTTHWLWTLRDPKLPFRAMPR